MDNDFEIELLDEPAVEDASVQLPLNFLTFGEIEPDDVKVYIKQDVYKALEKLAASDTSKELGSIIIGEYCQELGKTNVIISQYVEAKYTDASASTLTFTHETWDYIHSEHERLYSDKKIIGWQHTHPGYGIFLSNYDMFIQENFFNLPFQVAYVIDPVQNIRGFFQWKNGKVEKLKGYYIYDDVGKAIKIEQAVVKKNEPTPEKTSPASKALIAVLCAVSLLLSFFVFSLNRKLDEQIKNQNALLNEVNEQVELLEKHESALRNQNKLLDELRSLFDDDKTVDDAGYVEYTVGNGDTLYSICAANGLDYKANIKEILEINSISDANLIYTGQKLQLPAAK